MDRIVLVTKATRLDELVREHLTESAAAFSLETRGQSIDPYRDEHQHYHAALDRIRQELPNDVMRTSITREDLPRFQFRETDLVIACGPDGLFANLAKYLNKQLVLTVNPDPQHVTGALMLFHPEDVGQVLADVASERHTVERLPLAKASIDGRKVVWAVNDLFIGRRDHVSARYELTLAGKSERQSSSGIIVSTGVGASGWLRSVTAMVEGLSGGSSHLLSRPPSPAENRLLFVVREPFPSPSTGTSLIAGNVTPGRPLVVTSAMPDGGYIFSDGVVEQATGWNAGSTVTVTVGDRYVHRLVP